MFNCQGIVNRIWPDFETSDRWVCGGWDGSLIAFFHILYSANELTVCISMKWRYTEMRITFNDSAKLACDILPSAVFRVHGW